jgi:hypothetical protein
MAHLAKKNPWRLQGGWHLGTCCTLQWALGGYHCGHWHQCEHQQRGVGSDAWPIFWIFADTVFCSDITYRYVKSYS